MEQRDLTVSDTVADEADRLYDRYGTPLEAAHRGEYVAIGRDGRTLLAPSLLDVVERAAQELGPESFVFKLGDRTVGTWLSLGRA
jgi:hypothetical protein